VSVIPRPARSRRGLILHEGRRSLRCTVPTDKSSTLRLWSSGRERKRTAWLAYWCIEQGLDRERARGLGGRWARFARTRRELDQVGGFDSGQWMYDEGPRPRLALARHGWKARIRTEARVNHRGVGRDHAGVGRRSPSALAREHVCVAGRQARLAVARPSPRSYVGVQDAEPWTRFRFKLGRDGPAPPAASAGAAASHRAGCSPLDVERVAIRLP